MSLNCRLEPTEKAFNEMEYRRKKNFSEHSMGRKKVEKLKI